HRQKLVSSLVLLISLLFGLAQLATAQTRGHRYLGEAYAFYGRRNSTPGTSIAGVGGDVFIHWGLAVGGEVGTTIGNPDDRITIVSADVSYHFFCCRASQRVEPFVGGGFSDLAGDINTHGYTYPFSPGQDRSGPNFSQGLIVWATKRVGLRLEIREYRMLVSYGALENVIPGGNPVEFHIGFTFR
ncbi:MAG: hypothetical protein ACRD2G_08830, partial [Terriglobia bacterium]